MSKEKLPYVYTEETEGNNPYKKEALEAAKKMCNRILQDTAYSFTNIKTGEKKQHQHDLNPPEGYKLSSGYNDWKYWNGVIHMAMLAVYKTTGEEKYRDYVLKNYRFAFDNLPFFEKLFQKEVERCNFHQFFRLDRLDDFGAMATGLIEAIEYDPYKAYHPYLDRILHYITEVQDRLPDGVFVRNRFGYTSLWGDDMFMGIPILVRLAAHYKAIELIDDAVNQAILFTSHLHNPQNGLFFHCRYVNQGQFGVAHWGRANGWMVLAMCDLLDHLPNSHQHKQALIGILNNHLISLSRFQAANGMWHQLIDKTDSFYESSSTAMFTYGFAKAINEGWMPDIYAPVALEGWKGLSKNITEDGILKNVSEGFNFKQELPFYYNRPVEEYGEHGVGAAIMAALEVSKLGAYRDCIWC